MIPPFDFQPQTRVVFGVGALARLGELAQGLGIRRALLVTDPGIQAAGHASRALESLHAAGLEAWLFDGVEENPTERHVRSGLATAQAHSVDSLVAVGGGSSMDCAKGINFLYTNGGRMPDYIGFGKALRPMLPSIGVPTTAGTGSEAQSYALIVHEQTHQKMACGDRKAAFRVAVLDPALTSSQPARVTAATGVDAMAHAVESYVCTRRGPLAQMHAQAAWQLLDANFPRVLRDPADLEARSAMQLGAHFAGTAIENAMLGACHACANPLTARHGITHGVAIGIMLPHIVQFNAPACAALYAKLTQRPEEEAPAWLAEHLQELIRKAGLPGRLAECGVGPSDLPALAGEAARQWTAQFNPRPVNTGEMLALYEASL